MSRLITRTNPDELHRTPGYHHVTVVEAGRTAYLAGQCPLDRTGEVVAPGELERQVDQIVANAVAVLAAVGAGPADVVRSVIYVVSSRTDELGSVWQWFNASALAPAFTTASTLVGVAQLGFAGQRVELDLTAALPN
ncbi:RidA family protein [Actinopolymorpha rutila]|uniref:Enamine deaminase RidA (YjgF/YER057c/UK114 family) n=1 Tax=Actinopolymorpha rutila TaxID=446787 RepID=A0A852ZIA5_9ACTN|nr:Rid family hydrolase [Actinopolymorpha rutila]NYH92684.1 enamine deaminase RidA (YjgF/YER057c/UK114 family) [Actinopolymorpha rutila]